MRRLILASIFVSAAISPSLAQQPSQPQQTYTFRVSADDANRILNKMSELPWKDVNSLMKSLIDQVATQNAPPPASPPSPVPPAPVDPKE